MGHESLLSRRSVMAGLGASCGLNATHARAQPERWWDFFEVPGDPAPASGTDGKPRRSEPLNDLERDQVPWRSDEMIGLMDAAIARIERLAGNGCRLPIAGGQTLRVSDSDERVVSLKARLGQAGLLRSSPGYFGSPSFDERDETAIHGFQDQTGLRATGRLDRATLTQLNVRPEVRLSQLKLNRCRIQDLPCNPVEDRHVFVNAAAFQLEAVERYQVRKRHRVVVGKADRQTPAIKASIRGRRKRAAPDCVVKLP